MYSRAKYRDDKSWESIKDPVSSKKYDGAHFYMEVGQDGYPRFISRRESVKGGFPDRTEKLPLLSKIYLPNHKGEVYNVELIHTGKDKNNLESHPTSSGILNSLPDKAKTTQDIIGPIRAVLLDVVTPKINTYIDKIKHLKDVEKAANTLEILFTPEFKFGHDEVKKHISDTLAKKEEGVIITSAGLPEEKNFRIKIKHINTYNLKVVDIIQEVDVKGNLKNSAGALVLADATDRIVGKVGTGFSRELRIQIWLNKKAWMGRIIQVKALPPTASKLRSPVYNGDADGLLDTIK